MDYAKIIKDSWIMSVKHRYLWVFGVFAGMGGGFSYPGDMKEARNNEFISTGWSWLWGHPVIAIMIAAGLGLLLLIHFILVFISYGALIKGAAQVEQEGKSNFDSALSAGLKYFWPNVGIVLLTGLMALGVVAIIMLPFAGMLLAGSGGFKVAAVIWLILCILPLLLAIFGLVIVAALAARICVIEDAGVWDSFKQAWLMCKTNISESATLGAISIALGIGISIAITVAAIALAIPFIILGLVNIWLGLVPGGLVGIALIMLLACVYGVFTSAYWTLGYLQIKAKNAPSPQFNTPVLPAGEVAQ
ncbi:hypothetical protein HY768_07645 [candidate division TA06 bacterium]|uniref:Uncharacterized protein n=1 Tax=candidate division TA06 bacterium TaxID=2250710 RepID=A0A933IAX4_UNCT6|nr:hypothetical protein [candidate division TA06 bacterium]